MKKSIFPHHNVSVEEKLYDESVFNLLFTMQAANLARFKQSFTLVFIAMHPPDGIDLHRDPEMQRLISGQVSKYLNDQVRHSDVVFPFSQANQWVLLLPHAGEKEARFFISRLFAEAPSIAVGPYPPERIGLSASIVEVANSQARFEEVLKEGTKSLQLAVALGPFQTCTVDMFKKQEIERIRVSIIEDEAPARAIMHSLIQRTDIDHFELDMQTFEDGEQFLSSSWHQSGHTHLVILKDFLPKKNGVEVVQALRQKPNPKKYIIFMIANRQADDEAVHSYSIGVDKLITKPFNIGIFQAEIKSLLMRLRA